MSTHLRITRQIHKTGTHGVQSVVVSKDTQSVKTLGEIVTMDNTSVRRKEVTNSR